MRCYLFGSLRDSLVDRDEKCHGRISGREFHETTDGIFLQDLFDVSVSTRNISLCFVT